MTAFAPDSLVLNRKLPLWYQVSQSLRASILGRTPDASLRLPTEEQLAGHYGVSVLTMRQALKELEGEGLISRHRRRGTFIEPGALRSTPVRLLGSVDAIVAQQSGDRTTILGMAAQPCPGSCWSTSRARPRWSPSDACATTGRAGSRPTGRRTPSSRSSPRRWTSPISNAGR